MVGEWSTPRPCPFTPGNDPIPIVQEVGWAPGPVWTGSENLAPNGIRSPDRKPIASRYTDYAIPARLLPYFWEICDPWYTQQWTVCNFIFWNFRPLIHLAVKCLQFYFLELPTPHTPSSELFANLFFWNFRPLIHLAVNCLQICFLELPTPDTPSSELFAILFFGTSDPLYT